MHGDWFGLAFLAHIKVLAKEAFVPRACNIVFVAHIAENAMVYLFRSHGSYLSRQLCIHGSQLLQNRSLHVLALCQTHDDLTFIGGWCRRRLDHRRSGGPCLAKTVEGSGGGGAAKRRLESHVKACDMSIS